MTVYSEEIIPIPVGIGINMYSHPAYLQDGECQSIVNFIAEGDRLVTRKGLHPFAAEDTRCSTTTITGQTDTRYSKIPNSDNSNWPAGIYTAGTEVWGIRQFNRANPETNDGDGMVVSLNNDLSGFQGACAYLDRLYVNKGTDIGYVTAIDWDTGDCTFTSVGGNLPSFSRGLFVFKDRMWSWDDTKIYYTDVPASPGAYPEVWDDSANFFVIAAASGLGKIYQIIPVGTKLFVFTGTGLYNVSIIGSPENWVVRLMDAKVCVNSSACAIEDRGFIYFIDSRGVWVTNQSEIKEISIPIRPIFEDIQVSDEYYRYKLVPFDNGILACRIHILVSEMGTLAKADAKLFYTRFEDISWSEFAISIDGYGYSDVHCGFANLETYDDWNRKTYIGLSHGTLVTTATHQLMVYEGVGDAGEGVIESYDVSEFVKASYTSKIVRGQVLQRKRGKYGYINYACEGNTTSELGIEYAWQTESDSTATLESVGEDSLYNAEGLVKIEGPEYWRALQFHLTAELSDDLSEITIMGSSIINHTGRREPDESI